MSVVLRCVKCSGVLEERRTKGHPVPNEPGVFFDLISYFCPNCRKEVTGTPEVKPSPFWDAERNCLKPFTVTIDPTKGWPPEVSFKVVNP